METVFISHADQDAVLAQDLTEALRTESHKTGSPLKVQSFSDPGEAVEGTTLIIMIISAHSLGSSRMEEHVRSRRTGVPIMPILSGISHEKFQEAWPAMSFMTGSAASIAIGTEGIRGLLPRILKGIAYLQDERARSLSAPRRLIESSSSRKRQWVDTLLFQGKALGAGSLFVLGLHAPEVLFENVDDPTTGWYVLLCVVFGAPGFVMALLSFRHAGNSSSALGALLIFLSAFWLVSAIENEEEVTIPGYGIVPAFMACCAGGYFLGAARPLSISEISVRSGSGVGAQPSGEYVALAFLYSAFSAIPPLLISVLFSDALDESQAALPVFSLALAAAIPGLFLLLRAVRQHRQDSIGIGIPFAFFGLTIYFTGSIDGAPTDAVNAASFLFIGVVLILFSPRIVAKLKRG